MEFMAGTGMTPEKQEALGRLARLCESQSLAIGAAGSVAAQASERLAKVAADAERAGEERMAAAAAVRERAAGASNAALADASGGNWAAVKLAGRLAEAAGALSELAASIKEDADRDAAEASDILYHLTN